MYKVARIVITTLCLVSTYFLFSETPTSDEPNTNNKVYPIAIIGSGAGGTMAVKRASLNNRETILFTGAKKQMKSGRGHWVRKVENIPGLEKYTRTINQLREETLALIADSPFAPKLTTVHDSVLSVEKQDDIFIIRDFSGKTYQARYVVMATGMMDEQPHINGSIDPILPFANKQFIAYCMLCDGHRSIHKKTVVIGHSEDAAKNALLLANRYSPATLSLLTNGIPHTISDETLTLLAQNTIQIIEEPIQELVGNAKERLFTGFLLQSGQMLEADIGFVSLGIRPNNQLALALGAKTDEKGLVETDENGESTVENLFIVGDLRANSMKQIYTAWQHAVDAMQVIDRRLRAE